MKGSFAMKLPVGIIFGREIFTPQLLSEMLPLLVSHWSEVAHFTDIPLNIDLNFYRNCEEQGILRLYTFRRNNELLGYAVFFVKRNPHYQTSIQANQDVLFLSTKARGPLSLKFIRFCDNELRAEGVQAVYHHVKVAHNFGLILQRMGYELTDLIYARRLDKED
jgi:hypothetical protein